MRGHKNSCCYEESAKSSKEDIVNERLVDLTQQKLFLKEIDKLHVQETQMLKDEKKTLKEKLCNEILKNKELQKDKQFLQKEVVIQNSKHGKKNTSLLIIIPFLFIILLGYSVDELTETTNELQTRYVIENLRGDVINTWKSWRLVPDTPLIVNILNSESFSSEKINIIKEAILSEDVLSLDDSITHKGPKGSTSSYYLGWIGALKEASKQDTKFYIPYEIDIIQSNTGEGHVLITLTSVKDSDGNTGFTKSTIDGNEILKSAITIYDVNNLDDDDLATITRHEFGHALGLAHSTAPEDLMAPRIDTPHPYISECNIDAIVALYDGNEKSRVVCEK